MIFFVLSILSYSSPSLLYSSLILLLFFSISSPILLLLFFSYSSPSLLIFFSNSSPVLLLFFSYSSPILLLFFSISSPILLLFFSNSFSIILLILFLFLSYYYKALLQIPNIFFEISNYRKKNQNTKTFFEIPNRYLTNFNMPDIMGKMFLIWKCIQWVPYFEQLLWFYCFLNKGMFTV